MVRAAEHSLLAYVFELIVNICQNFLGDHQKLWEASYTQIAFRIIMFFESGRYGCETFWGQFFHLREAANFGDNVSEFIALLVLS